MLNSSSSEVSSLLALLLVGLDHLQHRADVLLDVEAAEDRGFLRQVADAEPRALVHRQRGDVVAVELDAAGVGFDQPGDHVEDRGLAGAVRPEQADRLAAAHVEAGALHHLSRAEGLFHRVRGEIVAVLRDMLRGLRGLCGQRNVLRSGLALSLRRGRCSARGAGSLVGLRLLRRTRLFRPAVARDLGCSDLGCGGCSARDCGCRSGEAGRAERVEAGSVCGMAIAARAIDRPAHGFQIHRQAAVAGRASSARRRAPAAKQRQDVVEHVCLRLRIASAVIVACRCPFQPMRRPYRD